MMTYFQDRNFLPDDGTGPVLHAYFGRQGGVSTDIYAGLNCGIGSQDDKDKVRRNRAIVAETLGIAPENLLSLYQIHSDICLEATGSWPVDARPEADALVTDKPGLALAILTADCAPVLFSGRNADGRPVIGAAHAGWGGALKGVLESTLNAMEKLGADQHSIRASIGPCILQSSYEVEDEFAKPFLEQDPANDHFFKASRRAGRLMFDLPGYCARRLAAAGVRHVSIKGLDTYFNEEDFYSFRRATHRSEPDYGRQVSAIMIR